MKDKPTGWHRSSLTSFRSVCLLILSVLFLWLLVVGRGPTRRTNSVRGIPSSSLPPQVEVLPVQHAVTVELTSPIGPTRTLETGSSSPEHRCPIDLPTIPACISLGLNGSRACLYHQRRSPGLFQRAPYSHVEPSSVRGSFEGGELAVIVIPGGAYRRVAFKTEGQLGMAAIQPMLPEGTATFSFIYTVPPPSPDFPQLELEAAVTLIRRCADLFHLRRNPKIAAIGFSAGGHLLAMAAARGRIPFFFIVLAYPVVTMRYPYTHNGSRASLLGDNPTPTLVDEWSAELHTQSFPRLTYIWHTVDDEKVAVENARSLFCALTKLRSSSHANSATNVTDSCLKENGSGIPRTPSADGRATLYSSPDRGTVLQEYRSGLHASWTKGKGDTANDRWAKDLGLWLKEVVFR